MEMDEPRVKRQGPRDEGPDKQSWVMLIYRLPREPSRPRVAVWRKLKTLGALYLQDGVAVLPEDAVTREHLEWLQLHIREAGGEATVWETKANSEAESRSLVEAFRSSRKEAYEEIIAEAERLRRKAEMGAAGTVAESLFKLGREFRAERKRDYFRSPLRQEANAALKATRQALREPGTYPSETGGQPETDTEAGGEKESGA
ncbi:MAG: chromate resistance protein [Rubrobacter sp.]|nr:chromate resistance protein [Rubrobacter sp.]